MKHSILLYGSFAVLGIFLLMLAILGNYLDACDAVSVLAPFYSQLVFLLGGMVLATVGIVGIGRQRFKNNRKRFTALAAVLVPLSVFGIFFVASWNMIFYAPMFPMRSEITQLTVVDNSPLILSLNVKAITSRDSRIDGAFVLNSENRLVAEFYEREWIVSGGFQGLALAALPAGSEITLTLNFNKTLPSGTYLVSLSSWHVSHGSAPFTIP